MAIDPVQSIHFESHDTAIELDLRKSLRRIAELPPSPTAPYVTMLIDWRPDGTQPNSRPGRNIALRKVDEIVGGLEAHTAAEQAISAARDQIGPFLDSVDPSVQGLYIVAGGEQHVFETVSLGVPVETTVCLGPVPLLLPLAHLAEDHPAYAVLVADQREANLFLVTQTVVAAEKSVEGAEYPRKQQQGGWSQRRYQMRADERIAAFARTVAEETQRTLERRGIDLLIVATDEGTGSALNEAWHPTMKERIVDHIQLDIRASGAQVVEAATPIAERAARDRERVAVDRLVENVGGPMAVGGAERTLLALQEGRVMHLVLRDDFHADGWVDYSMPIAGVGKPGKRHPTGGDPANITLTAIEEELIRLALAQGASIEIVRSVRPIEELADGSVPDAGSGPPKTEAAAKLDEIGGVGAILRYAIVDSGDAMPEAR
jgi:hypothetical protein